jgi:xylulose-5-phosphate/fructose-6-phosphate phosphoketolase
MTVMNDLDRFHLFGDVIDRLPQLGSRAAYARQFIRDRLFEHKQYITTYGEDLPEIRNRKWSRGATQKGKPLAGNTREPEPTAAPG